MSLDWLDLSANAIAERRITALTDLSAVLFLAALTDYKFRDAWNSDNEPVSDSDWDDIQKAIAQAEHEAITSMIGMIIPHALAVFDALVLPCDGAIYNRTDYPLLYAAIDPVLIIDSDTFRTPNLVGRFPLGESLDFEMGAEGGAASHTLTVDEMPSHSHGNLPHSHSEITAIPSLADFGTGAPVPSATPAAGITGAASISIDNTGGNEPHNNMPPYFVVRWVIVAG